MNEDQILNLIESNDLYNRQWFIHQASVSKDITAFYTEFILPDLEPQILALAINQNFTYHEAQDLIDSEEFLVLTDQEADDRAYDYVHDIATDAMCELPKHLQQYFNFDLYIDDLLNDGRGNILAHYDGYENQETIDDTTYYIYRMN